MNRKRNLDKIQYLTEDELKRLMAAIEGKRDRAMFLIAYRHGLRASEVGLLQTDDVDVRDSRIRVHRLKDSLPATQRMEADELRLVKAWLKIVIKPGPLFPSNRRVPISRRTLDYLMKGYCEKVGIPRIKAHFHTLKHTVATHLLNAGMGIEHVQDWLGHANIENTQIYAKLTNRVRDETAQRAFSRLPRF